MVGIKFVQYNLLILNNLIKYMAEGAGFEPALGYSPKHAFQACDLNRSSTLPKRVGIITYASLYFKNHLFSLD